MSKIRYISRDLDGWYKIWKTRPKRDKFGGSYLASSTDIVFLLGEKECHFLSPQLKLKPGQLAKVNYWMVAINNVPPKVAVFTLGEIVEDHGKK